MSCSAAEGEQPWAVYLIRTEKDKLYTGITTDLERRFQQHASGRGAKYFRSDKPVEMVYSEWHPDRSSASRREYEIKQLSRREKLALIG